MSLSTFFGRGRQKLRIGPTSCPSGTKHWWQIGLARHQKSIKWNSIYMKNIEKNSPWRFYKTHDIQRTSQICLPPFLKHLLLLCKKARFCRNFRCAVTKWCARPSRMRSTVYGIEICVGYATEWTPSFIIALCSALIFVLFFAHWLVYALQELAINL